MLCANFAKRKIISPFPPNNMQSNLLTQLEQVLRQATDASFTDAEIHSHIRETLRQFKYPGITRPSAELQVITRDMIQPYLSDGPSPFDYIPSGFDDFDRDFGGFVPGELSVIAGRPGMGKTLLLNTLAVQLSRKVPVLMLPLEQNAFLQSMRIASVVTDISYADITRKTLTSAQKARLEQLDQEMQAYQIRINDSEFQTISALENIIREEVQQHGVRVVCIDYLQMLSDSWRNNARAAELGFICLRLHGIARELGVTIIATSQLSRGPEYRGGCKRPMMVDIRDSGIIEQECDRVMFLYRPEYYAIREDEMGNNLSGVAEWIIVKNRVGKTGTVSLSYDQNMTRFLPFAGHKNEVKINSGRLFELDSERDAPF